MTTLANKKFIKVIDKYLETGDVTVEFDKKTLVTYLNGEGFTPQESNQLVEDFGSNQVFRDIMVIVNNSPVATEARNHILALKELRSKLSGDTEIDFQEDIDDLDYDSDEDDSEDWVEVTVEEFLGEFGKEGFDGLKEALKSIEEEMRSGVSEIEIDIPGFGKGIISKVAKEDKVQEDISKNHILDTLKELLETFADPSHEIDDEEFLEAKSTLEGLPKEALKAVKLNAITTLGRVVMQHAEELGLDTDDLEDLAEILSIVLSKVFLNSGDKLPMPTDFVKALVEYVEENVQ